MKKAILIFAALLLSQAAGLCQYNHSVPVVQSAANVSNTCTFLGPVTAGNLLMASMSYVNSEESRPASPPIPTISDSLVPSWTLELSHIGPDVSLVVYAGFATSSGSDTITFTGGTFQNSGCTEFPPYWSISTDGSTSNDFTGTPSTVTTTTPITTTQNNDLLYSVAGGNRDLGLMYPSSGYMVLGTSTSNDSGAEGMLSSGAPGSNSASFGNSYNSAGAIGLVALTSNPLFITSPTALPSSALLNPYSYSLQAAGGVAPLVWSVIAGALPGGLSLSSGGVITGTPTASSSGFTVQVTDGTSTVSQACTLQTGLGTNSIAHVSDPMIAGFPVTAGDALIVTQEGVASNAGWAFPTDTQGTAFTFSSQVATQINFTGDNPATIQIFIGIVQSTGTDSMTCRVTSFGCYTSLFTNVQNFGSEDGTTNSGYASGSGTITSNTLTPLVPNELLMTAGAREAVLGVLTPQAPFTATTTPGRMVPAWFIASTITGYTSSYTIATADGWIIYLGGFRPTSFGVATFGVKHRSQVY